MTHDEIQTFILLEALEGTIGPEFFPIFEWAGRKCPELLLRREDVERLTNGAVPGKWLETGMFGIGPVDFSEIKHTIQTDTTNAQLSYCYVGPVLFCPDMPPHPSGDPDVNTRWQWIDLDWCHRWRGL